MAPSQGVTAVQLSSGAIAALACVALAGCGASSASGGGSPTSTAGGGAASPAGAAAVARERRSGRAAKERRRARRRRPHESPGALPQTMTVPSAASGAFRDEMAALWQGIRTGSATQALPAFFPEAAYAQVKAIANPRGDYANRLVRDYALDIRAAHALLGARSASAQLIAVQVPADDAHWVPPNVCSNQVGYYEVPNSRVVYLADGATRSLGIASMISWRGVWYVIHLGAVLRPGGGGVVDDPQNGAGVSAPSSTC